MAAGRLGIWAYWRGGISRRLWWFVVSAPVILAGMLVTFRDGVLTLEYQNVSLFQYLGWRSHWHWYVIAILVYWILVLFFLAPANTRTALRKQKERHRESFRRYRERSSRPPIVIVQGTPDPPNLSFRVNVKRVYRDKAGVIYEQDDGSHFESDFYAVTCAIKNALTSERKVGDLIDVSAHLTFRSVKFEDGMSVDKGLWLGLSSGKVSIPRNDMRDQQRSKNPPSPSRASSHWGWIPELISGSPVAVLEPHLRANCS